MIGLPPVGIQRHLTPCAPYETEVMRIGSYCYLYPSGTYNIPKGSAEGVNLYDRRISQAKGPLPDASLESIRDEANHPRGNLVHTGVTFRYQGQS